MLIDPKTVVNHLYSLWRRTYHHIGFGT
jgi:hypothetical protein